MGNFRIYNGFGITPTKSYSAAGWDFYIPNITAAGKKETAYEAFRKSYNKKPSEVLLALSRLEAELSRYGYGDVFAEHDCNLLHLLWAIDGSVMRTSQNKVDTFIHYYLTFNEDGVPGIRLHCNDHVFINSGIKVALDKDTAGVFMNKSGKGNKGFDTRACVVDEDYSGYVHLSNAYTKDNAKDGAIYCGEKFSQMLLLPIVHKDACEELSAAEYGEIMSGSERGEDGFGSTDKK